MTAFAAQGTFYFDLVPKPEQYSTAVIKSGTTNYASVNPTSGVGYYAYGYKFNVVNEAQTTDATISSVRSNLDSFTLAYIIGAVEVKEYYRLHVKAQGSSTDLITTYYVGGTWSPN